MHVPILLGGKKLSLLLDIPCNDLFFAVVELTKAFISNVTQNLQIC